MPHERRSAVDRPFRPDDLSTARRPDALMTKTDAENGDGRSTASNHFGRDACLGRRTGARRQDDMTWPEGFNRVHRDLVVAAHHHVSTQLTNVPRQVVDKGVVVVDDENHAGLSNASIMPRALSRVSRYS